MGNSKDWPRANVQPPDLNNPKEVLQALLSIEWSRLETATRIEEERNIVFPETTIIIRDIQKLMGALGLPLEEKEDIFGIFPNLDLDDFAP
ncbi:MAG: hypothetical protein KJ556_20315 [Gammaproteobacteria bacterium]|nr:hypothetical protein [Gammaproteobacteria bacterium]